MERCVSPVAADQLVRAARGGPDEQRRRLAPCLDAGYEIVHVRVRWSSHWDRLGLLDHVERNEADSKVLRLVVSGLRRVIIVLHWFSFTGTSPGHQRAGRVPALAQ